MPDVIQSICKFSAAILWTIFGLAFWVPLVVKVVLINSVLIFASAFGEKKYGYKSNYISDAVWFYFRGFSVIHGFDYSGDYERAKLDPTNVDNETASYFVLNTIWAAIFWVLAFQLVFK